MVTIVLTKSTSPFRISAKRRSMDEAETAIRRFFSKSLNRYDAQVIVKDLKVSGKMVREPAS